MTAALQNVLDHLTADGDRVLDELIAFASIPSVSTDPAHDKDITDAASWVSRALQQAGPFSVRTIPTAHNPVIYA